MNADISELLPIGSVVLLKEGKKKVMIFGIRQTSGTDSKEYDYIGVVYPEGNFGTEYQFLFNHESINEIVFRGYEDEERKQFISRLSEYYQKYVQPK